jgi:hypothetical protein
MPPPMKILKVGTLNEMILCWLKLLKIWVIICFAANLKIVEIPDDVDWEVVDYDGMNILLKSIEHGIKKCCVHTTVG